MKNNLITHSFGIIIATAVMTGSANAAMWNFSFTGNLTTGGVGTGQGVFAGVDGLTATGSFTYHAVLNDSAPSLYNSDDGSGYMEYGFTVVSAAITFNSITSTCSSSLFNLSNENGGVTYLRLGIGGTQGDIGSVDITNIPFGPALAAFTGRTGTGQLGWAPNNGINYDVAAASLGLVPSPGAAALIGLAGLVATRRRRN
jgi:MYXO-CTERM domain-containing protein